MYNENVARDIVLTIPHRGRIKKQNPKLLYRLQDLLTIPHRGQKLTPKQMMFWSDFFAKKKKARTDEKISPDFSLLMFFRLFQFDR